MMKNGRMIHIRGILAFFVVPVLALAGRAGDDDAAAVRKALQRTIDAGVEILRDKTLDDAGRLARFDTVLAEACHLELMAKLALGKGGWAVFDDAQRESFVASFRDLIKRSYYGKVAQQDMESFAVEYTANEEIAKGKRSLAAMMKTRTSRIEVVYKFYVRDNIWRIYDVEVEGISLIASYRSQFDDFLANRTAAELLAEMKKSESCFLPDDKKSAADAN